MGCKKTSTIKGALEYVSDILPSAEEIRDEIGNFISQLICGPERYENREAILKKLEAFKRALTGAIDKDNVLNEIVRALDKFEAMVDEAISGAEKNLKKAGLLAMSCAFVLGAIILDRRWKVFFDTVT